MATRTLSGETESGDLSVVASFPSGALAAAVDGLGHGPEAARAARVAVEILERFASEPLPRLVERSHDALAETRGAVMSLARFDVPQSRMTWLGVGNVEATLLRAGGEEAISCRADGGIVGYRLPPLRPATLPVGRGDLLVFTTDGIRAGFARASGLNGTPEELAGQILAEGNKGTDDALALVVRYLGEGP
ncbi:MAG TPA: SpoIIE family protein phosphatase [Actinomycetota bacterium]